MNEGSRSMIMITATELCLFCPRKQHFLLQTRSAGKKTQRVSEAEWVEEELPAEEQEASSSCRCNRGDQ